MAGDPALMELARVLAKLEIHGARQVQLLEEIADALCGPVEDGEETPAANGEAPKGDLQRVLELKKQLEGLGGAKPPEQPKG